MLDDTETATVTEQAGMYVLDLSYRLAPLVPYVLEPQAFWGFAVQGQQMRGLLFVRQHGEE
jgi:hypothetical protein